MAAQILVQKIVIPQVGVRKSTGPAHKIRVWKIPEGPRFFNFDYRLLAPREIWILIIWKV